MVLRHLAFRHTIAKEISELLNDLKSALIEKGVIPKPECHCAEWDFRLRQMAWSLGGSSDELHLDVIERSISRMRQLEQYVSSYSEASRRRAATKRQFDPGLIA